MKKEVNLKTIVKRLDDDLLSSALAEETIMMNVETGDYLGLNEVATSIWNLLENPITIHNICEQLLQEFDVEQKNCEHQTISFLQELLEKGLIAIENA